MLVFLSIVYESFMQAFHQLYSNKLRSLLSLLGITIGIWCIIMVFAAVNSLEYDIRNSMQELGNDVVYVTPMPWGKDPREELWKYERRPDPSFNDFRALKSHVKAAQKVAFSYFIGGGNADYVKTSASNVFIIGVTEDYRDMFGLSFELGRYFSGAEFFSGINSVVIGHNVAQSLFRDNEDPLGKTIKIRGQQLQIVGVLEKEGNDLLNPINYDNVAIIPYNTARKFVSTRRNSSMKGRAMITVKAKDGVSMAQLQDQITSTLRAERRIKPSEETNFELNTLSILSSLFDSVFSVINAAGFFIGIFAIIVGVFSVANIMFVSVKERTPLIGIKKALGAKRYVILLEFLIESVVLCLVGGLLGLLLVYLAAMAATAMFDFEIFLSMTNLLTGIGISVVSGVVAGIIPAYSAARMVPVEAIRANG